MLKMIKIKQLDHAQQSLFRVCYILLISLCLTDQLNKMMKMKKEVLEKRRCILSKEYLNMILAMNNLTNTLRKQDQLDKTIMLLKIDSITNLSKDH